MRLVFTASPLAAALFVAGCSLGVPVAGTPPASGGPEARVSVKKRKPIAPPARVNLTLPPSLGMVAAGGGNLLGPDGASLIGNDAGSLVSASGGTMVAAGSGNVVAPGASAFGLLASGFGLQQAAAGCEPTPTGYKSFVPLVYLNSAAYVDAVMVANASLRAAREADPNSEEPFAVSLPGGAQGTAFFTARGESGGLLRVAAGPAFDASRLVMSLAYDTPQRGRLVYRAAELHEAFGRLAIAMTFDLTAGQVSADGAADATMLPPAACGGRSPKARVHWEFRAPKPAAAGRPVFTMQASANFYYPDRLEDSGGRGLVLHFDAQHRGAARMGRVLPGDADLKFTREDGQGYTDDPATFPAAYFLASTGAQVPSTGADPVLKGMLPTLGDFYRPFPANLDAADPLAEQVFTFIE